MTDQIGRPGGASISPAEVSIRELLERDYSETYPHHDRGPERSAPPLLAPYTGVSNPVLSTGDVTDVAGVTLLGDPIYAREDGMNYLFFEVYNGEYFIGYASSPDMMAWTYEETIMGASEPANAYPFVFKHDGEWYMYPATWNESNPNEIVLYKADSFPGSWSIVDRQELPGAAEVRDVNVIRWNGTWYAFGADMANDRMYVHYTDSFLDGGWTEHPQNPVITGIETLAGRPIPNGDHLTLLIRAVQPIDGYYGVKTRTVTELSKTAFSSTDGRALVKESSSGQWGDSTPTHADLVMSGPGGLPVGFGHAGDGSGDTHVGMYGVVDNAPTEAMLSLSADQTIPSGSFTTVAFDQVEHDYPQARNGSAYVVPETGLYRITASVVMETVGGATTPFLGQLRISVNGTNEPGRDQRHVAIDTTFSLEVTRQIHLEAGETVEASIWHNAGQDLSAGSGYSHLTVERVR